MAVTSRAPQRPLLVRFTPQMVLLFIIAAAAAYWTIREAHGMWDIPGTMGYSLTGFLAMWAMMMAAMMLPSVAPYASTYARTVQEHRFPRLSMFAAGYLAVWILIGVPAYLLARLADEYAGGTAGTVIASAIFLACGIYQLTPIKDRCLAHCRTPLSHLLHAAALKGRTRDLRAGFQHGLFCAACCWGLMALLIAFGVMNVPAMIVLAAVIATEKLWARGEYVSRGLGALALLAAVAVFWLPGLAPGLTNEPMDMDAASMDESMTGEETMSMDGDGDMATDGPALDAIDSKNGAEGTASAEATQDAMNSMDE